MRASVVTLSGQREVIGICCCAEHGALTMGKRMDEHQDLSKRDDHHAIRKQLDQVLLSTFCRALDTSYLTPMTVLSTMAEALGSVYRQVADSHLTGECRCGWEPALLQDIERLQLALGQAAQPAPDQSLSTMQTLGRA